MINLIPPAARRKIVKEYWVRAISVWMFLLGTSVLVVLMLLLPVYVLIQLQLNTMERIVESSAEKAASYDTSAADLNLANKQARLLVDSNDVVNFSAYAERLENIAGADIEIRNLQFTRNPKEVTVTLVGQSLTRQMLADYRDALEADPAFLSVDLPISNLIKDRDLPFSMNIIIASTTTSI